MHLFFKRCKFFVSILIVIFLNLGYVCAQENVSEFDGEVLNENNKDELKEDAIDESNDDFSGLAFQIGTGLGVSYGVLGLSADIGFSYFSLTGGFGTTVFGGPGYAVGLKAYIFDRSHKFRPHLIAVYGTTAVVMIQYADGREDKTSVLNGFGFYGCIEHDIGDPGAFSLTYGLGYITWETPPDEVDEEDMGAPIKAIFGINYRFNF